MDSDLPIASASNLPSDRQRLLAELAELDRAFEELWDERDDGERCRRPEPESWSLAEILDHLVATDSQYLDAMEKAVERSLRPASRGEPLKAGPLERLFVAFLEPPVRWRMPAPRSALPPADVDPGRVWGAYRTIHDRLADWIRATADLDLYRIRFPDPLAPLIPLRVSTGLLVLLAHGRRHLDQARRSLANPASSSS